jgi:hypothetical protein
MRWLVPWNGHDYATDILKSGSEMILAMAVSRKRKLGKREPNGRPLRPTVAQLVELQRAREETEKQVVLAQPHRRGERDQKAASALGRFCLRHKLEGELYQAGEDYGNLVRRWRIAKGIPVQGRPGRSLGLEPDGATVRAWGRRINEIEDRLLEGGPGILGAIGWLILSDCDPHPVNERAIIYGLRLLADELDLLKMGKHPYRPA